MLNLWYQPAFNLILRPLNDVMPREGKRRRGIHGLLSQSAEVVDTPRRAHALSRGVMQARQAGSGGQVRALIDGSLNDEISAFDGYMNFDLGYQSAQTDRFGAAATTAASTSIIAIYIVIALMLTATILICWLLIKTISRPIKMMTAAMRRLADNDLSVLVPGLDRRDEVGEMAKTVQVFKDNAGIRNQLTAEAAEFQNKLDIKLRETEAAFTEAGASKLGTQAQALDRAMQHFSTTAVPVRNVEWLVELTYIAQITPWLTAQPDIQYVINPGGGILNPGDAARRIGNELVLSGCVTVIF